MTLSRGSRLGPYEIVAPLGAGGMGEVYRARDTRLAREVAIKVLPVELAQDRERLSRFEQEARSASALNHPNIVAVYDVGRSDSTSYIAMELVEGNTVRELLVSGALPLKRSLSIAAQAAEGLAKAHAAGIVHRDLKPENLMVSSDGFVKILDFGLAKLTPPEKTSLSDMLTMAGPRTASGVVVGTVGYMSPEQASGSALDLRSDQFAFGAILYEMLTGRRAFERATAVDTLSAILHDEPEPVGSVSPGTPVPLRWIVERCLAKDADERYASTRDLARDLALNRDRGAEIEPPAVPRLMRTLVPTIVAAVVLLALAAALLVGRRSIVGEPAAFQRLTFRRGTVYSARFAPGGTIVYGAAWEGQPVEIFFSRPESPESRPLGIGGTNILSISPSGEMAVSLRHKVLGPFGGAGALARMPLAGTAPREMLDGVSWADWTPDGKSLAVVRRGTQGRLEFPVGKVVFESTGWISHPRVSADGAKVAFLDHPISEDDRGNVMVVSQDRKSRLGESWATAWGLAWSPDGNEVWFTAAKLGFARELRAVSLSGKERVLTRTPGTLTLHDVSPDGRVLLGQDDFRFGIRALPPGGREELDLSWLDISLAQDLSDDGRKLLISEAGEGGGEGYSVYLRGTDGSPAVRLGQGIGWDLSPDGRWVLCSDLRAEPPQLFLLPTGTGEAVPVTRDALHHGFGQFLPDGKRIVFSAREPGRGFRIYVQSISGGKPEAITNESDRVGGPVSPDGKFVPGQSPGAALTLYPIDGGVPRSIGGARPGEQPIQWSTDGRSLYVMRENEFPSNIFRLDPISGKRELWKDLGPSDSAGVVEVRAAVMTRDARAYAYTYVRILSNLYLTRVME
jgi:Tol biopolymer transport system component